MCYHSVRGGGTEQGPLGLPLSVRGCDSLYLHHLENLDRFFLFAILPPYSVAIRHDPCKVDTLKPRISGVFSLSASGIIIYSPNLCAARLAHAPKIFGALICQRTFTCDILVGAGPLSAHSLTGQNILLTQGKMLVRARLGAPADLLLTKFA